MYIYKNNMLYMYIFVVLLWKYHFIYFKPYFNACSIDFEFYFKRIVQNIHQKVFYSEIWIWVFQKQIIYLYCRHMILFLGITYRCVLLVSISQVLQLKSIVVHCIVCMHFEIIVCNIILCYEALRVLIKIITTVKRYQSFQMFYVFNI